MSWFALNAIFDKDLIHLMFKLLTCFSSRGLLSMRSLTRT